ncbi:glycosyltransferase [Dysgonomonas sp. ZJ709]|uniref:glycosyltransferase family protein n=1 Tax=Dysgonomonas sp. ZJ709 TaxID=2709797 RepID=UPI0013ED963F|nr:glycosyltransferase [Dysgonomonas sp. ZJ709]
MRILLIGEYSRVHLTLAEGLRVLGHEVVVASDGDRFKDYPRDIDLTRKSSGFIDTLLCLVSVFNKFSKFKGYDVVQIINPCFVTLNVRINQYLYKQLKKNNKRVFLGAFGDDSYWVRACLAKNVFKYSEFFVDGKSTNLQYNQKLESLWINSNREIANNEMAVSSDGIVACLYEYYKSYEPYYSEKLAYIPLPINTSKIEFQPIDRIPDRINFFIGINKDRSEYKGTDVMDRALIRLARKYPDQVVISRVESVGYDEYQKLMMQAHVVLDQLYSYSPAMNALLAMAQGKVVVGGGEPEMYELLDEDENRPIINVYPTEDDVFNKLEYVVLNKHKIPDLSQHGRLFVDKHHDFISVARQYLNFWGEEK